MNNYYYDDDTHTYWFEDKKLISVTNVAKALTEYYYKDKQIPAEVIKKSQDKGNKIHQQISDYILNNDLTIFETCPSFKQFVDDYNPKFIYSEKKLFSKIICGTIDALIKIDDDYYICDFKTTSMKTTINSNNQRELVTLLYWKIQLFLYKELLQINGFDKPLKLANLILYNDNYKFIKWEEQKWT